MLSRSLNWMPLISLLCIGGVFGQTPINPREISMGEHPRDTVGVVGGIVTLRCVVRNKGQHSVYWFRHGAHKYLSRDDRIFHLPDMAAFRRRISIQGNSRFGEFNLRIANVSIEDNDQYSCMYFLDQQFVGMSEPASLTVYMPPNTGGPRCEMQPPREVGPGHKVTMVCSSSGSLPYTRLDWKHRVEILPGTLIQGARPKALYEVRLTDMDNGASFTCEESSPALYQPRKCSITPFFIPTNVTVIRKPQIISTGADIVVFCDAAAVPMKVNYTWVINNRNLSAISDSRIVTEEEGRILRISSIKAEDNGTVITCIATNVLNLRASADTSLTIHSEQLQSVAQTGKSSKNIAIIGGVVGTLVLLCLVAVVAIRHKRRFIKKEPARIQQGFHDHHYLDEHNFGGVAICNTPRDAIAEHMKEYPDRETTPNDGEETAARVLLVALPPRTRPPNNMHIKPVLPPISPVRSTPRIPPPLSSPTLSSDEMPPSLPPIEQSLAVHEKPMVFPKDRLPGMPGKYHAKGPLPRPPPKPSSPPAFSRTDTRDFLRC
ncbi:cell adhesion molecule 3-like [Diadema antillarum]|uniref:cell adhesion molecule 3-like n=1 Tax=Diadema antillarum TaxID=105358 RepID=UPI003A86FB5A